MMATTTSWTTPANEGDAAFAHERDDGDDDVRPVCTCSGKLSRARDCDRHADAHDAEMDRRSDRY